MAHDAILNGDLRTPDGVRVPAKISLSGTREALVIGLESGDRIEADAWSFTSAAIWLRGAIDGLWTLSASEAIAGLVLWADLQWTVIAPGDLSRSLPASD